MGHIMIGDKALNYLKPRHNTFLCETFCLLLVFFVPVCQLYSFWRKLVCFSAVFVLSGDSSGIDPKISGFNGDGMGIMTLIIPDFRYGQRV